MADVFISYAHEDRELVLRIVAALDRAGREAWYDEQGIEPSDEWWRSVTEAIDAADAAVFIISADWIESETSHRELDHAVQANKRLVPVKVADIADDAVPDSLRQLDWILLGPRDDFDHGVAELVRAIELDLELVRVHTRVLTRARAWELAGKRPSPLLRGEELRQAEAWRDRAATGVKPQPNELQSDFIAESRRRATRRQWIALATTLAVAVLAIGLAAFAFIERHQAQVQRDTAVSRELASQALARLASDPQGAVRLAAQAVTTHQTTEAKAALLATLAADDLRLRIRSGVAQADKLALDPTGTLVAVGGSALDALPGIVRIVNLATGTSVAADTQFSGNVNSLAFDSSGTRLVATSSDSSVVVLDARSGAALRRLTVPAIVSGAQLSDDDTRLALLTIDGQLAELLDVASGKPVGRPLATGALLVSLLSGGRVAVVAPRGIGLFDVHTGALLRPVFAAGRQPISGAALSPDGKVVVLTRRTPTGVPVEVWDLTTGALAIMASRWGPTVTPQLSPFDSQTGTPSAISPIVSVSPGGRVIALAQAGAGAGALTMHGSPGGGDRQLGVSSGPGTFAFTPDGTVLATVDQLALRVFGVATGTQLESSPSPAGKMLIAHGLAITADPSGEIAGWRLVRGGAIGALWGNDTYIADAITPDARVALAASSSDASLYDTRTGRPIGSPLVHEIASATNPGDVTDAGLSPDGRYAVVVSAAAAQVFDIRTRAHIGGARVPGLMGASFSRDGDRLLITAGSTTTPNAGVWDWRSGTAAGPMHAIGGTGGAVIGSGAALSPDGSRVATLTATATIGVYDASSGKQVGLQLRSPRRAGLDPASPEFSPDGSHLLARSASHTDVWTVGSAAPSLQLAANGRAIAAAYSPDGSIIATTGQDPAGNRALRLWRASNGVALTGQLVARAIGGTLSFSGDGKYVAAGPTIWSVPDGVLAETLTGDYVGMEDVHFAGATHDLLARSSFEVGLDGLALHTCELCLPIGQLLALARRAVPSRL